GTLVPTRQNRLRVYKNNPLQSVARVKREQQPDAPEHSLLNDIDRPGKQQSEVQVKSGHTSVIGDNCANRSDSRVWGKEPHADLIGRAFMTWLSIDFSDFGIRWSRLGRSIE